MLSAQNEFRTGFFKSFSIAKDPSVAVEFREKCRSDQHRSTTANCAPGFLQANLALIPQEFALDFLVFCLRNPVPCPLLDVTQPGNPHPPFVAPQADLRTDLPNYHIFKNGVMVEEVTNIIDWWRDDLVGFLFGCSYSWDTELVKEGLTPKHFQTGTESPMYRTSIPLQPSGPFKGNMIVSMRPYRKDQIDMVVKISSSYPSAHGGPVHIGDPKAIGINRLNPPGLGNFSGEISSDEVPMFWGCGVTPTAVLEVAQIPFAITQGSGLLVTDLLVSEMNIHK